MLAALEHGGVTHDGGRHVPGSHKNTLCTWSPLSAYPLASRPSQRVRKMMMRRSVEKSSPVVEGADDRSRRGRGRAGEAKNFPRNTIKLPPRPYASLCDAAAVARCCCYRRRSSHRKHPRVNKRYASRSTRVSRNNVNNNENGRGRARFAENVTFRSRASSSTDQPAPFASPASSDRLRLSPCVCVCTTVEFTARRCRDRVVVVVFVFVVVVDRRRTRRSLSFSPCSV